MRRILLAVVFLIPALGTSCEPLLTCGNPLDGSEFGFQVAIPAEFECQGSVNITSSVGAAIYRQIDNEQVQVVVILANASSDTSGVMGSSDAECTDIGSYTNANGLVFERCMVVADTGVSYSSFVELPDGVNRLLISLIGPEDDASFSGLLEDILDGVSFQ